MSYKRIIGSMMGETVKEKKGERLALKRGFMGYSLPVKWVSV